MLVAQKSDALLARKSSSRRASSDVPTLRSWCGRSTLRGWLICFSCVVLGASCGGRAISTHGDPSGEGGTTNEAGTSGLAGSLPSTGGASAQAGASSTGGNAQAGTANAGGTAQAGTSSVGGNAQAGAPSEGGNGAGGTLTVTKGDPASIQDACSVFCDEFNRCPDGEGNLSSLCDVQCFDYAYRAGSGECTAAGVDMLACLTLADRAEESDCANAFTLAIEECAELVDAFRDCQVDFPAPNQSTMLYAKPRLWAQAIEQLLLEKRLA